MKTYTKKDIGKSAGEKASWGVTVTTSDPKYSDSVRRETNLKNANEEMQAGTFLAGSHNKGYKTESGKEYADRKAYENIKSKAKKGKAKAEKKLGKKIPTMTAAERLKKRNKMLSQISDEDFMKATSN